MKNKNKLSEYVSVNSSSNSTFNSRELQISPLPAPKITIKTYFMTSHTQADHVALVIRLKTLNKIVTFE